MRLQIDVYVFGVTSKTSLPFICLIFLIELVNGQTTGKVIQSVLYVYI